MVENKKILIGLSIVTLMLFSGCVTYGSGETTGYVTTIEDGFFWGKVWIRSDLESSQTNCYLIKKHSNLKDDIIKHSKDKTRITLYFDKHLVTLADTNEGEITNLEVINNSIVEVK